MQIICFGARCYLHNFFPFTVIFATLLGLMQIFLTWQVIKLRGKYKRAVGSIRNEEFERKNGALTNFTSFLPITLTLYAIAENNRANCGLLFFLAGFYILMRVVHAYSLYRHETKAKSYKLRIYGMVGTFAVILALGGVNLYMIFTHFPY